MTIDSSHMGMVDKHSKNFVKRRDLDKDGSDTIAGLHIERRVHKKGPLGHLMCIFEFHCDLVSIHISHSL